MTYTRPVKFTGTTEERQRNRATHFWVQDLDGEIRCSDCDRKVFHIGADYPCGQAVPRETVRRS